MTCSFCGAEFEGPAKHFGYYSRHAHDSYCRYVFEDRIKSQVLRAERAENLLSQLVPRFIRPEGIYGQ